MNAREAPGLIASGAHRAAEPPMAVAELLTTLVQVGMSRVRAEVGPLGITLPQAWLLPAIAVRGPIPVGQLARDTGHSLPALTSALDFLERRRLVRRSRTREDRRRVFVELTPEGVRLLGRLVRRVHVVHERINSLFRGAEGEVARSLLGRIAAELSRGEATPRIACALCRRGRERSVG